MAGVRRLQLFLLVALRGLQTASACGAPAAETGFLLCRACGHEVALESDASAVPSRLALSHRNDTAAGDRRVTVQLFENPRGRRFHVVTFRRADVLKHWPADAHFTWFPGYAWTVATCPRCKAHLGWAFQPSEWPSTVTKAEFEDSEKTFVALVAERLLQEDFAASLLLRPKSFQG
ncbi:protein cereblon homolog [Denticeps clupeoides]|uniref:protein cereblon homolog n=1 Tax=Denticeps clupeoides TaxID=299321 RepID=UPI0010A3A1FB|nr:protein cereblon homolog [Denticeps clupeoides]